MRLKERVLVLLIGATCCLLCTFLVLTTTISSIEPQDATLADAFDAGSIYR